MSTNLKETPGPPPGLRLPLAPDRGRGMAAYPEMQTLMVDVHHWLTEEQLIHFYSLGQLAPGPT